jgi:exodeoxyribonuclease VII large subunit
LLAVPVIASVGHHTDRTVLDDVAAISCSTPTHAAEVAVGLDCTGARAELRRTASHMREHGRRAVLSRARTLMTLSRAPAAHIERQRAQLHQRLREVRAGSRRRVQTERGLTQRRAIVLERKANSTVRDCRTRRPQELEGLALALAGHDPQRTLERGYALVRSRTGEPIASATEARTARELELRFADDTVPAKVREA